VLKLPAQEVRERILRSPEALHALLMEPAAMKFSVDRAIEATADARQVLRQHVDLIMPGRHEELVRLCRRRSSP
jgi:hypothetical protein